MSWLADLFCINPQDHVNLYKIKTGVVEINPFDSGIEDGQCLVSSKFLDQEHQFTLPLADDLPYGLPESVAGSLDSPEPNLQQVYGFARNVVLPHYVYKTVD